MRDWLIERVALGEHPESELTEAERARLATLRTEDDEIRARYPAPEVANEVRRRARVEGGRARSSRRRGGWMWTPALAGVAALALVTVGPSVKGPGGGGETVRLKGQGLTLHRKTSSGTELLSSGAEARTGDRLQLGFRLDQARHVVLLSIDGSGVVTLHLPERGEVSVLEPQGTTSLPFSYELDDAPGFERFVLVNAETSFSVRTVLAAAEVVAAAPDADRRPLDLPASFSQLELTLRKVSTP